MLSIALSVTSCSTKKRLTETTTVKDSTVIIEKTTDTTLFLPELHAEKELLFTADTNGILTILKETEVRDRNVILTTRLEPVGKGYLLHCECDFDSVGIKVRTQEREITHLQTVSQEKNTETTQTRETAGEWLKKACRKILAFLALIIFVLLFFVLLKFAIRSMFRR